MISVVLLNYNSSDDTIKIAQKISAFTQNIDDVVIVDNDSTDDSREKLKQANFNSKVNILYAKKNEGYSCGNNLGLNWIANKGTSKYVLVANPDVDFEEEYLIGLEEGFEQFPEFALLSGIQLNPDSSITNKQYWKLETYSKTLIKLFGIFNPFIDRETFNIESTDYFNVIEGVPAGSATAIKMEIGKMIGFYDPEVFLFYEEQIIAKKIYSKGFKTGILTNLTYYHYHSQSINKSMKLYPRYLIYLKSIRYFQKYYNNAGYFKLIISDIVSVWSKLLFKLKLLLKRKYDLE